MSDPVKRFKPGFRVGSRADILLTACTYCSATVLEYVSRSAGGCGVTGPHYHVQPDYKHSPVLCVPAVRMRRMLDLPVVPEPKVLPSPYRSARREVA